MSTIAPVTAEQLMNMRSAGRCELIEGDLRMMSPAGWFHGAVAAQLHTIVASYIRENDLGLVFAAETGFLISRDPDTVRAPDLAFVHKDRVPAELPQEAYWPGAPDLAAEILSPNDSPREVAEKVQSWLDAGCQLVWVIDPVQRAVIVHKPGSNAIVLAEENELSGNDVITGFQCPISSIFRSL